MSAEPSRCTMQRHKQLTLQRCKTSRASNAKHPFLTTIKVFRQTEYYVLVLGGYYINCSVCLLRFVAGLRNQAKYDKINSDIKQDLRII